MREAVLDTRVDLSGRALVLFGGAPLQGCSGLEISAAVNAISAWAAANNGVVRMHTTLPDGSTTEDLIHGDGTIVPATRSSSGRRTAVPAGAPYTPPLPVPAPTRTVHPAPQAATLPPLPVPVEPRPVHPAPQAAALSPLSAPVESLPTPAPALHTQESWRMPLEDDDVKFDVEALIVKEPLSGGFRRGLVRAGVIILLAAVAAVLGVMFLLPAPGAEAAVVEPALDRVSSVSPAPSGIGDDLPENRMLTFSLAGGLAVAAGGAAGLSLTKVMRRPKLFDADDPGDELLLDGLDLNPLPGEQPAEIQT